MGLFDIFKKKGGNYDLSDMSGFDKHVLLDCLDLAITAGIGAQYKDLQASIKNGKLNKKQMTDCRDFALWYKNVVLAQPNLKEAFGESSYNQTVKALQSIEDYAKKKL